MGWGDGASSLGLKDVDFQRRYEALKAAVASQEECTEESFSTLLVAHK